MSRWPGLLLAVLLGALEMASWAYTQPREGYEANRARATRPCRGGNTGGRYATTRQRLTLCPQAPRPI